MKALYGKVLESRIFDSQAMAKEWGDKTKEEYKMSGNPVKVDVVPADATRRRWKAIVYLKV